MGRADGGAAPSERPSWWCKRRRGERGKRRRIKARFVFGSHAVGCGSSSVSYDREENLLWYTLHSSVV